MLRARSCAETRPSRTPLSCAAPLSFAALCRVLLRCADSARYMELAEHPKKDNSFTYSMATEEAIITTGVRWFNESGEHKGGIPLEDDGVHVYCFHDGSW